jgi:hypothetical protein
MPPPMKPEMIQQIRPGGLEERNTRVPSQKEHSVALRQLP